MSNHDELLVRLDNLIRTHEGKLIDCHDAAAAIRELEADAKRYQRVLELILEEAEDREDVEDGDMGPRPNIWMRIAEECRAAMKGDSNG